jgi:lysophospholipase L1-like esterase
MAVDLRAIAQDRPLRILPLGDSITEGYDVPGGYRIRLCAQLDAWSDRQGIPPVDWVGSLQHGPPDLRDRDHEGHSGWRIDQLQAEIVNWLTTARPDGVLLLIGTNDLVQAYDLDRAPERLNQLMTTIQTQQPGVWLWVATVPPMDATILGLGDPVRLQEAVDRYNQAVRQMVSDRAERGEAIILVELAQAVDLADLPDGVHPNRIGYDKIADAWFSALMLHLDG